VGVSGQSPAVGSVASAGARRDDTVGASRRVGRADVSISWPAVVGTGFSVSRRLGWGTGVEGGDATFLRFAAWAAQGGLRFYVSRRCGCGLRPPRGKRRSWSPWCWLWSCSRSQGSPPRPRSARLGRPSVLL